MRLDDRDFDDLEIEDIETVKKRVERRKRKGKRRGGKGGTALIRILVPVILGVVILACLLLVFGRGSLDDLKGVKLNADIASLFGGLEDNEAGIILNDRYETENKAYTEGNRVFLPYEYTRDELNDWFYYDENEGIVLYTTPEGTDRTELGSDAKIINGVFCLSSELVRKYTDLEYREKLDAEAPYIYIRNSRDKYSAAVTAKKTALYLSDDKKSDVLSILEKKDKVRVLDAGNEFSRVQAGDGLIGYVVNKSLEDYTDEEDTAPGNVAEMEFPATHFNQKIVLGWHQVMNKDANQGVYDILLKDSSINVLSPTWYSLKDTEGAITDLSSAEYVQAAHEAGKQVWPVVDNFNCTDFKSESGSFEVLSHSSKRQILIESLVSSVKESGADGINVDFERLTGETGVSFAQFIKELSLASHAAGLILSVDNYVPEAHSMHYYRGVQGRVADYVVIMGYDEYNAASTEAGPVASLDFVENGIEKTLMEVDASKLINGLPFYSRVWETKNGAVESTHAAPMSEASELLSSHGVTPSWDDGAGCNYGEYESDGSLVRIWLEDEESMNAKLSIMDGYHLAGAAFWKLGLEDESVWDDIAAYAANNAHSTDDADGAAPREDDTDGAAPQDDADGAAE